MYPTELLEVSEQKTRKNWLRLLLVFIALQVVCVFFDLAEAHPEHIRSTEDVLKSFFTVIFAAFCVCLPKFFLYRCAYKKPGTKYLTFCIPFLFISPFAELRVCYKEGLFGPQNGFDAIGSAALYAFIGMYTVLGLALAVQSVRFRKINKRLKKMLKQIPVPT